MAIRKVALYNVAIQFFYCGVSYGIALYVCCILTLIHFPFASALQEAEYDMLWEAEDARDDEAADAANKVLGFA